MEKISLQCLKMACYMKNWIYDLPNAKNINLEKNSSLMFDFGILTKVEKCLGDYLNSIFL